MAEAFGAAAGVLSVVSLSIQLAESVQKIKSFHADIRHACPRLKELVEEIEVTCEHMRLLEHETESTKAMTSPTIRRCMSNSRRVVEDFVRLASELESYAKKKRIRGGLRYAFRQEEITGMFNRMERAKALVDMAYMQHQIALQQQQLILQQHRHDELMQAAESIVSGQALMLQRIEPLLTSQQCAHCAIARNDHRRKLKLVFKVRIPGWMNHNIWHLAREISIFGWQFTMRTYGVVSQNAPIIKACQLGDTVAMQRLFNTGAASPFDQTPEGFDLVSYCVLGANIDTIRFLLDYGITSNNRPISYGLFWQCSLLHDREEAAIDADVKFLRTEYDDDDARTKEDSVYDKVAASLESCTPEEAVSLHFWRGVYHCRKTAFLDLSTLPSINTLLTSYESRHLGGQTQLQLLAALYGRLLALWLHPDMLPPESAKVGVENFIQQAITIGLDVHAGSTDYTPLTIVLGAFCCFWPDGANVPQFKLHKVLITWLRLIERAGVNLHEYGQEELRRSELQKFPQTPESMFVYWYKDVLEDVPRWTSSWTPLPIALSFGNRSSDWKVTLLGYAEECSHDFWNSVGAQVKEASYDQCLLPGGWVEN